MASVVTSAPGDAGDMITDQRDDDEVRPGRELRQRERVAELLSVIQCWTSTAKRCISGTAELPPPIANKRKQAKKPASVSIVAASAFIVASTPAQC